MQGKLLGGSVVVPTECCVQILHQSSSRIGPNKASGCNVCL